LNQTGTLNDYFPEAGTVTRSDGKKESRWHRPALLKEHGQGIFSYFRELREKDQLDAHPYEDGIGKSSGSFDQEEEQVPTARGFEIEEEDLA
jgi:hypothetical protein